MKSAALLLVFCQACSAAQMMCFESDKSDVESRTPWSHHTIYLSASDPVVGPDGKAFVGLHGYGKNDAPTPNGSTDLVALTGAAVRDIDGYWLVSLIGLLHQQSTIDLYGHEGVAPFWIISQSWKMNMRDGIGTGHYGNLMREFGQFSNALNDSVDTIIVRVTCGE